MNTLPDKISWGEKYDPAMKVLTEEDAKAYFEKCVEHNMRITGNDREEAERIERMNIGYWAGYFDRDTARRVYELYKFNHPLFGDVDSWPTPEKAFEMGMTMAEELAKEK